MQDTAEMLQRIQRTDSSLDKQYLLKQQTSNKRFKEILKFIYNPYFKTCISDAKLDKAPYYPGYPVPRSVEELMVYLREHPTGDEETCGVANTWMLNLDTPQQRWLGRAIITQKLHIGINVTTLNKVYGSDFIPKISCMLGIPINKIPVDKLRWPYIVTEKLDGVRRILVKQNGSIRMYSRNGHEDNNCVDIINEATWLPDNYAYDGELLAIGTFKDSIAQRQATNSRANSSGAKHHLTFNLFDMVPVNEFLYGHSSITATERKIRLAGIFADHSADTLFKDGGFEAIEALSINHDFKFIRPVPILCLAMSMSDIEPIVHSLWDAGKEGVMLNDIKAGYDSKRVKTLIKMKKTETYVLRIEGFTEGTGKFEDSLGALITEYCDCYLQVGSGFTDAERYEIWTNQDKYLGSLFEVEAFGESTNRQGLTSLNCPIFKRLLTIGSEIAPSE